MDCPKIGEKSKHFTGTGDLLAAMLLVHLDKYELLEAVETSVNIVRCVLHKSLESRIPGVDEISIVSSKSVIEHPVIEIKAV